MIKLPMVKKQLEAFFKDNGYKYIYINKKNKKLSIPMYLLRLNVVSDTTREIEEEINVMITIFSSGTFIFIEAFNIYKLPEAKNILDIYKLINHLNSYSFPGKFILDNDNTVSYRCSIDYSNLDILCDKILTPLINSIPPAYFIFLEELEKEKNTNGR